MTSSVFAYMAINQDERIEILSAKKKDLEEYERDIEEREELLEDRERDIVQWGELLNIQEERQRIREQRLSARQGRRLRTDSAKTLKDEHIKEMMNELDEIKESIPEGSYLKMVHRLKSMWEIVK
tara:strand:+ start:50 stop:424 length:375 start_codon:yes stop_codon:yes gene_type:complete